MLTAPRPPSLPLMQGKITFNHEAHVLMEPTHLIDTWQSRCKQHGGAVEHPVPQLAEERGPHVDSKLSQRPNTAVFVLSIVCEVAWRHAP